MVVLRFYFWFTWLSNENAAGITPQHLRLPSVVVPIRYKSKVQIISIRWLSERVIMTMDRQERVHVIDVKAMVLVDIVDVTRVQLTFNDRFSVQMCKERKRDPAAPALKACVHQLQCTFHRLLTLSLPRSLSHAHFPSLSSTRFHIPFHRSLTPLCSRPLTCSTEVSSLHSLYSLPPTRATNSSVRLLLSL